MTPEIIARLVRDAERMRVGHFEHMENGCRLRLTMKAAAPSVASTPARDKTVKAPAAGVFIARHPGASASAPAAGRRVVKGDIVGFLRVGWCLRPVTACDDGILGAPLIADGQLVGYSTPLYFLQQG